MAPIVIAHRTCPRDAPENSLAGIAFAATAGADAVEIDVRLSGDGVPVLMHDAITWRMTRRLRRVRRVAAATLTSMRLRGSDERVPTLDAALAALPDRLQLAIDLKDPAAGRATLDVIRRHRAIDRVLWWSQHDAPLELAVAEAPELETALLRDTRRGSETRAFLDDADRLAVAAVSAKWEVVDGDLLEAAHGRGLRVYSWCRSLPAHREKIGLPLDGVVTDWPGEARAILAS